MPPKKTAAKTGPRGKKAAAKRARRNKEEETSSSEEEETSSEEEETSSEEEESNDSDSDPEDNIPLAQRRNNSVNTAAAAAAGARAVQQSQKKDAAAAGKAAAGPKDVLADVAQIFSDVHLSSTTHSDAKRRLLNLFSTTHKNKTFEAFLDAVLKATVATCVTLDTSAATRHIRFLRQVFEAMNPPADRVVPVLFLVNGLYARHNCAEDSSRLHVLSAVLELVRSLPENSASPPWFSDLVEVIKMRCRDKCWQVREKAVQLLAAFARHAQDDDVTQVMLLVACEDTRTEVRRTLLRLLPPKSIYFPVFVRALDDKVALVRKQAWTQLGHYSWVRVEAYGARSNVVALVAMGLADSAKTVQQECGLALRNWSASRAQMQNGVPPTAVEMLTMLIGVYDPNCDMPPEQQTYISSVADHLFREHESSKSKKKGGGGGAAAAPSAAASPQSVKKKKQKQERMSTGADDDDDDAAAAGGDDDDENEEENLPLIHRADLVAPLPYPLVLNGMTTANISMWAAHCRAAVTAGKTDLEERLLPPLRRFAQILQEAITAFHETFETENQTAAVGVNNKLVRISKAHEAEHIIYILLRTFTLYRESGYLAHIDHESTEALARTFTLLLLTTMDPVTTFCAEAVEALFAIGHKKSVSECVSGVVQSLFRSLTITRNYGLVMDDCETFGRRDRERRLQVREMERRENMQETAQAWQAGMANDNLYMLRMMHVVLEYLSGRARNEKSGIPAAVDQAIRLGREWGGDPEVKTVAIRALGMMCLANPSIVPTYIGLLVHNATAPTGLQPHERNASIAASFDVLCEFGAGFFKRDAPAKPAPPPPPAAAAVGADDDEDSQSQMTQTQQQLGGGDEKQELDMDGNIKSEVAAAGGGRGADYDENGPSFDVQQWDHYCQSLLTLCVHPEGQVRRLAMLGTGKMLACNRFIGEVGTVGAALVQMSYIAPSAAELAELQKGVLTRAVTALRVTQEKCQIAHANDSLLFFCKSYGSSTPRRMRLMLESGIAALRVLLRRVTASHSALDAATRFARRLIAITDACGLELVRDIDPRFAEAAKARMDAAGATGGDGARGSGESPPGGRGLGSGGGGLDDSQASQLMSLPPLQDDAGNDLHAAARANPALWALLASNSMHEVLAEFLLGCVRAGHGNVVGQQQQRGSGRGSGGGLGNSDDDDEDADDVQLQEQPEELCTSAKQLCARSLAGLHLYKRDPESVNSMCSLIQQTIAELNATTGGGGGKQKQQQQGQTDLAAIITRFGTSYAKSCGRKSFAVAASSGHTSALESGRSSFAGTNAATVHASRESVFDRVNEIASPAIEHWFRGDSLSGSLRGIRRTRTSGGASSQTPSSTQTPRGARGSGSGDPIDDLLSSSLSSTAQRVTKGGRR